MASSTSLQLSLAGNEEEFLSINIVEVMIINENPQWWATVN